MLRTPESFPIASETWLVAKIRRIHETHLLHAIALRGGHYQRGRLVTRPAIRPEMNLGLRVFVTLRPEEALQLRNAADHRAVPHDRAIEVDVELDDLRAHGRGRVVGLWHIELGGVR